MYKRVLLIVSSVLILSCLAVGAYYYYLIKRDFNICEYIPSNSKMVVYVNSDVAIEQFFFNRKIPKFKNKPWKQISYFSHLEKIEDLGFDYFSNAAMVNYEDNLYLMIPLKSVKDFNKYIDKAQAGLFTQVKYTKEFQSCVVKNRGILLKWTDDFLYIIKPKDFNKPVPNEIFNVSKEKSFATTRSFIHSVDDDALCWMYLKGKNGDDFNGKDIKAKLHINDGLYVTIGNMSKDQLNETEVNDTLSEMNTLFYTDQQSFHFIRREFENLCKLALGSEPVPFSELTNSDILLKSDGLQKVTEEFITYEYDDNFNKVKKVEIKEKEIESFTLIARENSKCKVYSNHKHTDSSAIQKFNKGTHVYLKADQDYFKQFLPLEINTLKFNLVLLQTENNGNQILNIQLKSSNWRSFIKQQLLGNGLSRNQ